MISINSSAFCLYADDVSETVVNGDGREWSHYEPRADYRLGLDSAAALPPPLLLDTSSRALRRRGLPSQRISRAQTLPTREY